MTMKMKMKIYDVSWLLCSWLCIGSCLTLSGNQVAVLNSGDFTDFGYNNRIVTGVNAMESELNISGILIVSNVESQQAAIGNMTDLVGAGYKVIISTTSEHGKAAYQMATKFPDVLFGQTVPLTSNLPNMFSIILYPLEEYYGVGVFCGATTSNNKIGFVHPGPAAYGPVATINAFFLGALSVNPDVEMHVVTTGTFLDPDRETGAFNILVEELGVGCIAQQQDDLTIPALALSKGMFGLGTTGYPIRELYGQAIGTSLITDWTSLFVQIMVEADAVLYQGKQANHTLVECLFSTGNLMLDSLSYKVTENQSQVIQSQVELLMAGKQPYFCNQYFLDQYSNITNSSSGCLYVGQTDFLQRIILPGVHQWGEYVVPLVTSNGNLGVRHTIIALSVVGIFLSLCLLVVVVIYWNQSVLVKAGRLFLCIMVVGFVILFSGIIVMAAQATTQSCISWIWLVSTGFTITIGSLLIKNVRVAAVFTKNRFNKLTNTEVLLLHNWTLLSMVVALVAIGGIILAVYTGLGHPRAVYIQGVEDLGKYERLSVCSVSTPGAAIRYGLIAYHSVVLFASCIVGFLVRKAVSEELKEAAIIENTVFLVAMISIIVGTFVGASKGTHEQSISVLGFGLLAGTLGAMGVMFIPKTLALWNQRDGLRDSISISYGTKMMARRTSFTTKASSSDANHSSS